MVERHGATRACMLALLVLAIAAAGLTTSAVPASAAASDLTPFTSLSGFTGAQHRDFLGRGPTDAESSQWATALGNGTKTTAQAIDAIAHQAHGAEDWEAVARLYLAYFLRRPDGPGLIHWTDEVHDGTSRDAVSRAFAGSSEFTNRYGSLSDGAFVGLVYQNVLGRPGDAGGRAYWTAKLGAGMSRGSVMLNFSESGEFRRRTATTTEVVTAHVAMLRRAPGQAEFDALVTTYEDAGFAGVAAGLLVLPAYAARFPLPGAISGLVAEAATASAVLRWSAPAATTAPLQGYTVTPIADGVPQTSRILVQTATTATITGLTNGVSYAFDVAPFNANGNGATSRSNAVTPKVFGNWTTEAGNPRHDGRQAVGALPAIPTLRWKHTFTATPKAVIAAYGKVFAAVPTATPSVMQLWALDSEDGHTIWGPKAMNAGYYGELFLAYENGRVFTVSGTGLVTAVNASTGTTVWSVALKDQYSFSSTPTAANGRLFVSGAGSGGTLYGMDQATGAVLWRGGVWNGDTSSPAVDATGVYVSYACNQAYRFNPVTGTQVWHHDSGCEGGGGATTVLRGNRLYTRDFEGDLVLDTATGAQTSTYQSDHTPVFHDNLGIFDDDGTLRGVRLSTGAVLWSQAGDGSLATTALSMGSRAYVASSKGVVYGYAEASGEELLVHDLKADFTPAADPWIDGPGDPIATDDRLIIPYNGALLALG